VSSWTAPSARERWEIIRSTKSVAMLGASPNRARPSYFVATYLLSSSCSFEDVWFVHPTADEILGRPVYKSLADLPGPPDLVDVFRKPSDLPEVADEAIAAGAKTLWLQLGLWAEKRAQHAPDAGLHVVMHRCLKIDHPRWAGALHLAGFETGVISSRRVVEPRKATEKIGVGDGLAPREPKKSPSPKEKAPPSSPTIR
jgi:predicted CoA-binding protein